MKFRDKIFIVFKILIVAFIILEKLGHLRVPINKVVMVPSSTLEIDSPHDERVVDGK